MSKVPLLEIEPKELKFIFELKKQSSCSVQLTNNTYNYVAYKVKTTSPKKYSVRPNVGVLMPKSTCEFIVIMQAQRVAPTDMVCKDKFLIQSTIVPAETTNDHVTSSLFVKDGGGYVEENKLKVALISPPNSPELSPINGDFKKKLDHEKDQIYNKDEIQSPKPMVFKNPEHNLVNEKLKVEEDTELKQEQDMVLNTNRDVEELEKEAESKVSIDVELNTVKDVELKLDTEAELKMSKDLELKVVENVEELKPEKAELKVSKDLESNTVKNIEELKPEKDAELKVSKSIEELKLMEAIKEMKLKLDKLESKLNESEATISKLTEERRLSNHETKILQEKLADLINKGPRKVQVGFSLLYVCMVALICVVFGYRLHS